MPPTSVRASNSGSGRKRATSSLSRNGKKARIAVPAVTAATSAAAAAQAASVKSSETCVDFGLTKNCNDSMTTTLRERFITMFSEPQFATTTTAAAATASGNRNGAGTVGVVSNAALKERFGAETYTQLVPIINQLVSESRLVMSKLNTGNSSSGGGGPGELCYTLVSDEMASKFSGLDVSARMVYQVIEKASDKGIWTKEIRLATNIQQQALNKIFKQLENRQLIKPVKSVTAKAKKLYMLYGLQPSKELTGGVWYSDLEFDHEFISELRTFLLHCIRRMNSGQGVTLQQLVNKIIEMKVSKVQLQLKEVEQLVRTLVYDYLVEEVVPDADGVLVSAEFGSTAVVAGDENSVLYVSAKRISTACDFKWWNDVLVPDFHFRAIQFEDGVRLQPHENHYHTI